MLNSQDRAFFEAMNRKLAEDFNKSLTQGFKDLKEHLPKDKDDKDNTEELKKNTEATIGNTIVVKLLKGVTHAALRVGSKTINGIQEFGNVMSRSAVAANKEFLIGTKSVAGALERSTPKLEKTFGKFGFDIVDAGRAMDSAIRANIRNTGLQTQKFIATSTGLGNSLGKTNTFLATQQNVLGLNTESTIALGRHLLATADANDMLGESLYAAIEAFTKTSKEQAVIFGPKTAEEIRKAVIGLEGLLGGTGAGQALITSLTSDMMKIYRIGGWLGMADAGGQFERDPAGFIAKVLPAMAAKQREFRAAGSPLASQMLFRTFAAQTGIDISAFKDADIIMDRARKQNISLNEALRGRVFSEKDASEKAKIITQSSTDAAENMLNFGFQVEAVKTKMEVFGTAVDTASGWLYNSDGSLASAAETAASALGLIGGVQGTLGLGNTNINDLISSLTQGGAMAAGFGGATWLKNKVWPSGKVPTAAGPLATAGASIPTAGASPMDTPADIERFARKGRRAREYRNRLAKINKHPFTKWTKWGGAPLAGLTAGIDEYQESGHLGRATVATGGTMAGALTGAALGAKLGAFGGPFSLVTAPLGAILGGVIGAWSSNVANDAMFGDESGSDTARLERVAENGAAKQEEFQVASLLIAESTNENIVEMKDLLERWLSTVPGAPPPITSHMFPNNAKVSSGGLDR